MLLRGGVAFAVLLVLGVLWLATARHLTELIDGVTTVRVASLSPSPFGWNGTWLQFGPPVGPVNEPLVGRTKELIPQFRSLGLDAPGPLYGRAAQIAVDTTGKLVLSAGGRSFLLGVRTGRSLKAGDDDLPEFAAEPGDNATLVIERSLLPWPTPFELNVVGMGGTATTWKRYVYYRLFWTKPSGARLALLWAGEQPYDGNNLWRAPGAFLVKVDIH